MEYITTWDKKLGELNLEADWKMSVQSEKMFAEAGMAEQPPPEGYYLQFTLTKQYEEVTKILKQELSAVLEGLQNGLNRTVETCIRTNLELLTAAYKNMQQQYKAVRKDFCVSKPNIGFSANLRESNGQKMHTELEKVRTKLEKLEGFLRELQPGTQSDGIVASVLEAME